MVKIMTENTKTKVVGVCYKALDGVFNHPLAIINVANYECIMANSVRIGGDGFTNAVYSGQVVAVNSETNVIYRTEMDVFYSYEGEYGNSECQGPCAWRSDFDYYYMTEAQLEACGMANQDLCLWHS